MPKPTDRVVDSAAEELAARAFTDDPSQANANRLTHPGHSHDQASRERDLRAEAGPSVCANSFGSPADRALAEKIDALDGEGVKENNPKDAFGVLKASMSWVPQAVIMELALAMAEGGFKYGGSNYLVAAPRASVYIDGAHRHMFQFWTLGQDNDEESGADLHHVTKAIASLTVLRAAQINRNWIDDRPPPAPADFLATLNAKMVALAAKFPNPVARFLANGQRGPGRIL